MRIVGYARLSRASEESTSIARQHEVIETTCSARGLTLVGVEEDVDVSALKARLDRPGLSAARGRILAGDADAIMVWRLDRLCRSVGDFVTLLDEGLEVISATEPIDTTTPMGRAMAQVLQVFAELESRTTGLRTAAAREFMVRQGRWPGGAVPYGYRITDGEVGKVLEPDPAEAEVVRRMAADVLGGKSLYAVAMELNDEGVPSKYGSHWQTIQIKRILTGDAVLGRIVYKGDVVRDDKGLPLVPWEPLIAPESAARIRAMLPTGNGSKRRRKASRLLSGLVTCAGCGSRMVVNQKRDRSARYVCPMSSRGQRCEAQATIDAERLERLVEERYLAVYGAFKVTEVVEAEVEDNGLVEVEEAIRDLGAMMSDPDADPVALAEQIIELRAERERLRALPRERSSVVVETDETVATRWAAAEWSDKRDLLLSAGVSAEVRRAAGTERGRFAPERVSVSL